MQALVIWQAIRAHWKLAVGGLLLLALAVQSVRLNNANHRAEIAKRNLNEAHKVIRDLEIVSQRQIEQSQRNVDRVVEGARRNPQAERVEKAPLPGGCKSPPEVMSADL